MRLLTLFLSICCLVSLSGCSGNDGKVNVTGTVTWNGSPLKSGSISFLAPDESADSADIDNGSFTIRTKPGSKYVGITAYKQISVADERGDAQIRDHQFIPLEYNEQSTVVITIAATNETQKFDLSGEEIPEPQNLDADNRRPATAGGARKERESENRRPR